jgi:hypothetical protein
MVDKQSARFGFLVLPACISGRSADEYFSFFLDMSAILGAGDDHAL